MDYRGLDIGSGMGGLSNTLAQGYKDRMELERANAEIARRQEALRFQQNMQQLEVSRYGQPGVDDMGNPQLFSSVPLSSLDPRPDQATQIRNSIGNIQSVTPQLQNIRKSLGFQRGPQAPEPPSFGDEASVPPMMRGMGGEDRSPAGGRSNYLRPSATAEDTGLTPEELDAYRMKSLKEIGGHIDPKSGQVMIPAHAIDKYLQFQKPYLSQNDGALALLGQVLGKNQPAAPRPSNKADPQLAALKAQKDTVMAQINAERNRKPPRRDPLAALMDPSVAQRDAQLEQEVNKNLTQLQSRLNEIDGSIQQRLLGGAQAAIRPGGKNTSKSSVPEGTAKTAYSASKNKTYYLDSNGKTLGVVDGKQ